MLRRRMMMMARSMYRWIRLKSFVVLGRRVQGEGAPGEDGVSHRAMVLGRVTGAAAQPAADILTAKGTQSGLRTLGQSADTLVAAVARAMQVGRGRLAAYGVQLITVVKRYVLGRKVDGEAAPGEAGISRRAVLYEETTDAERADAEITRTKRAARTGRDTQGGAFDGLPEELARALRMGSGDAVAPHPAQDGTARRAFAVGLCCGCEVRPAADGIARRGVATGLRCKVAAATWTGPTTENTRWLRIGQARRAALYEARIGGNGLEVR